MTYYGAFVVEFATKNGRRDGYDSVVFTTILADEQGSLYCAERFALDFRCKAKCIIKTFGIKLGLVAAFKLFPYGNDLSVEDSPSKSL